MSDLFCEPVQDWPHVVTDGLNSPRRVLVERAIPREIDIPIPESSRSVFPAARFHSQPTVVRSGTAVRIRRRCDGTVTRFVALTDRILATPAS